VVKLIGLLLLTAVLVVAVIPLRTHAVGYDPLKDPPPQQPSLLGIFRSMYLTPVSAVLILLILVLAGFGAVEALQK
jgi:hypothetical protein